MKALPKQLGATDGAILIFSNVVGVGIFTTPGIVAGVINDPFLFLSTWIIGGLFAFVGALGYARLSQTYPKAGGEYIYLRHSFGPLLGFLSGWTSFVAGFSGAIAASAVGFSIYLKRISPGLEGQFIGLAAESWVAITLILLVAVIHVLSVKMGSRFHFWLGGLAIVAILLLVFTGLFSEHSVGATPPTSRPNASAFLLALVPVLFTYSGWNAAVYLSEEIRNPRRNMIRALILGTSAVVVIYVLLNVVFIKVLGLGAMASSFEIGYDMAEVLLGDTGKLIITAIILMALLSSVSAMIMAGPRIYFAMARDRVFPTIIQKLHPRFKTPYIAIIAQSIWTIVLVLSGTFEDILIYTGFSIILFSGLSIFALVIKPAFKTSLPHKVMYGLFSLASLMILANAISSAPKPALFGTGIILMGIPFYFVFRRS